MKTATCTKQQFDDFLAAYPRPLKRDAYFVCDPPFISYNDFELGNWPDSIVASHSFDDMQGKTPSGWAVATELPNGLIFSIPGEKFIDIKAGDIGSGEWGEWPKPSA